MFIDRLKKGAIFKKLRYNIDNIVIITIKPLQMNQILALNNPSGVDILSKK